MVLPMALPMVLPLYSPDIMVSVYITHAGPDPEGFCGGGGRGAGPNQDADQDTNILEMDLLFQRYKLIIHNEIKLLRPLCKKTLFSS